MRTEKKNSDFDKIKSTLSMVLRRASTSGGAATELQVKKFKGWQHPSAKNAWEVKGWKRMPSVDQLSKTPLFKDYLVDIFVKQLPALERQLKELDVDGSAADFSRFLNKVGLVPDSELHKPGLKLPKVPMPVTRGFAIAHHQAIMAVGSYCNNTALARHLPELGALMGTPSDADLRATFLCAYLAPSVMAHALHDTLPLNRDLLLKIRFKEKNKSASESVDEDGEKSHKATKYKGSELFVEISDDNTKELLRVLPLAYGAQISDTSAPQDDIENTARTQLSELKDANFKRFKVGQFELLQNPEPQV